MNGNGLRDETEGSRMGMSLEMRLRMGMGPENETRRLRRS